MAKKKQVSSYGENINHFNGIRVRVLGNGNLRPTLFSLSDVYEQVLIPLNMEEATNIQRTQLANFIQQRASLELKTTEIDEVFTISRIILFVKPMFTSVPQ